jgi:hypothetical protein
MLSKELTVTLIRPLPPEEEITLFGHSGKVLKARK